ncbi:MAG: hypothetical protein KA174_03910 [Chitinophagales bacterium]|nr:hypothetical protein [Chitinophagales bacterium]
MKNILIYIWNKLYRFTAYLLIANIFIAPVLLYTLSIFFSGNSVYKKIFITEEKYRVIDNFYVVNADTQFYYVREFLDTKKIDTLKQKNKKYLKGYVGIKENDKLTDYILLFHGLSILYVIFLFFLFKLLKNIFKLPITGYTP